MLRFRRLRLHYMINSLVRSATDVAREIQRMEQEVGFFVAGRGKRGSRVDSDDEGSQEESPRPPTLRFSEEAALPPEDQDYYYLRK